MKLFSWIKSLFKKEQKYVDVTPKPTVPLVKSLSQRMYEVAADELGVKEIAGKENNPRIIEYHKATSLKASADEIAWCASFINWCCLQVGVKGTNSAAARSFLNWGKKIELSEAVTGDVVIFKRGNSEWQGHVALYVGHDHTSVRVLGGNQSNAVTVTTYPRVKVLGIRRPV